MATLRTVIVDKDESYLGWDYSTLNTAESNEQGDISLTTGTDEYVVIECYATSGTADTAATIFVGWTTEIDNYIQIITPESHRHEGSWDTSTYRYEITDSGDYAIWIEEDYVRLEGLQFRTPSINANSSHIVEFNHMNASNDVRIEKCIIRGANSSTYTQAGIMIVDVDAIVKVGNNIIYDIANSLLSYCLYSSGTSYVYNNTLTGGVFSIRDNSVELMTAINNICQDAGTRSFYGRMNVNSGYSVVEESVLASAYGTTHKTGTVTSASTGKLVDSGGGLSSIPNGSIVKDTTDTAYAYVTAVDSDTILSISSNIFAGTENYSIFTNKVGTVDFDGSTYLLDSKDDVAIFKGTNLYTDSNYAITDDILANSRGASTTDFFDIGAHHSLEYVKVVDKDSGSGYDYTTLNSYESNEQANLTAIGLYKIAVAECYATSGTADTTITVFTGWTTEADNYIQVITPESHRHEGEWDTSTYRLESSSGDCFSVEEDYLRIEGLQIRTVSINVNNDHVVKFSNQNASNEIRIEKCIIRGADNGTYTQNGIYFSDPDAILKIGNNIIYDINVSVNSYCIYGTGTSYFYNNTCIGGVYTIRDGSVGLMTAINNICDGAGTKSIYDQLHANSGYNVVEEAGLQSAHGTTHKTGTVTSASTGKLVDSGGGLSSIPIGSVVKDTTNTDYAYVTAVDSDTILSISSDIFAGTENYSIFTNKVGTVTFSGSTYLLASGDTVAKDKGTDLSSDTYLPFSDDILNYTRPYNSVWDIGAHEYVPGGVTINLTGTMSPVTSISGITLYRTMDLSGSVDVVSNIQSIVDISRNLSGQINTTTFFQATIDITRVLSGTIDSITSLQGLLHVISDFSGIIAVQTSISGTLDRIVDLVGTINSVSNLQGLINVIRSFSGQIDGVSSLVALLEIGRDLSGTVSVLSSFSASIKRIVDLAGSIDSATDIQALIKAIIDLTGSVDSVSNLSGLIKIVRLMSGSIDTTTSLSAVIDRIVNLLGTIDTSTDISGLLEIVRLMSGSVDSISDISVLLDVIRNLSSTVDSVTYITALMHVISDFSGVMATVTDVTGGTILRTMDLTGSIGGVFNTASTIDVTRSLTGQIDGIFYFTATIDIGGVYSGTIDAVTLIQSTLDIERVLTGTINAVTSTQSSATVVRDLSGAIDSETLLAGLLHIISDFSGIISASTNVGGLFDVVRNLTGAIDSTILTSGSIDVIRNLSDIISTTTSIDSSLNVIRSLSGTSAIVTFIQASLTIETILFLTGTIDVNSAIAGSIRAVREFSGQIDSQFDMLGNLRGIRDVSGTIDVGTTIVGLINVLKNLSGDIATSTTLIANISRLIDLTGAIDVFTDLSSSSNIIRDLSGYIDTVTSTSGFLRNNIGLAGAIDIVTYIVGSLQVYDPDAFKEIIYLISEINKEITGDSQITKLLNYSSNIETMISQTGTITKILEILSNLNSGE